MNQRTLWILSPVYHDVASYTQLKSNILQSLKDYQGYTKINFVVVDDTGGQDPQIENLEKDGVHIITPPFNLGHQRAIVYGLRNLSNEVQDEDILITLDSDGEDRPEDISSLLKPYQEKYNPYLVSMAERTERQETLKFKLMYFFFKIFFRTLTGQVIKTGNYAAFSGVFLHTFISHPFFDLCYSSSFIGLKVPKKFIPCPRGYRYEGRSKMNFHSLILHGFRMLMPFLDKIAIRSLVIFSVAFGASFISSSIILGLKVFTNFMVPKLVSYASLILMSFSFMALGNFLILFSIFTQSQSSALNFLDRKKNFVKKEEGPNLKKVA